VSLSIGGVKPCGSFQGSKVEEPRAWHQDSRNCEVQNSKKAKSFVVGPAVDNMSGFGILTFQKTGGQDLCSEIPEIAKRVNNFDKSAFRVSVVEGSRNSKGEVVKS
jgi:hypothetical protein